MSTPKENPASSLDPCDRQAPRIPTVTSNEGPVDALRRIARHQPQAVVSVVSHWIYDELPETD